MVVHKAVVTVEVRPHPIAAAFHHLLTHPVVEIDGREHVMKWGTEEIPVAAGQHRIRVFFRYRGQKGTHLALASREFTVDGAARRVGLAARLGWRNGSRFRISEPVTEA
ncbi:hypothetical protein ACMATS_07300 [Streptoverticillium reticulum]|uniref:hypothetical protein n=1 Tax=Streptoverticillium reticulum TaxID=1433415 RepID=UPI0039BFEAD2